MATTQIEDRARIITPRNSRRNEIVAILLLACGLLLTLCLVSAAFYPNDPSWNSAGQVETRYLADHRVPADADMSRDFAAG